MLDLEELNEEGRPGGGEVYREWLVCRDKLSKSGMLKKERGTERQREESAYMKNFKDVQKKKK